MKRHRQTWLLVSAIVAVGCQKAPADVPASPSPAALPATEAALEAARPDMEMIAGWERDWPQWRGAHRNGLAPGLPIAEWPQHGMTAIWRAPIGSGYSSPVVVDGRLVCMAREEPNELVLCLDARNGKELWRHSVAAPFEPHPVGRAHGRGPKSTVTVHDGKVYAMGISGKFHCLDAESGKVVWGFDMEKDFAAPQLLFGMTSSPLIDAGHVITQVGGSRGGTVIAFDQESGEVAWKSLHDTVSYSSFVAADLAGTHQIVGMTGQRVVGLRAEDGKLLWEYPFQIDHDESIPTPVIWKNRVVFTSLGQPIRALEIRNEGGRFTGQVVWRNRSLSSYIASPVAHQDTLFGLDDSGRLVAMDLGTGKTAWEHGNFGQTVSLIVAGDRLLVLDGDGELLVIEASAKAYRELGRSQVAQTPPTWAYPAIAEGHLYVRDLHHIACFDLRPRTER